MPTNRPFVLSIAGLYPSGGTGILSDAKTFEQLTKTKKQLIFMPKIISKNI
jgi:hydroxymethylpyrimidine/phosphomethylpyrimidine kinase